MNEGHLGEAKQIELYELEIFRGRQTDISLLHSEFFCDNGFILEQTLL